MSIWLQKSASIQTRTSLLKFEDHRFCRSQFRSHAERFRTCVSSRVSVKRYVQNKILRRCASMYNKWHYTLSSTFEILHHLLPSIFVLTFFGKGVAPDLKLSLAWYSGFSCVFHRFSVCFSPLRQSQPADHMSFAWYWGFSRVTLFSPLRQIQPADHMPNVLARLAFDFKCPDRGKGKGNFEVPFSRFPELFRARSRLYRSQILQVNTRWKALAEIYTMHSFAPFWNRIPKTRKTMGRKEPGPTPGKNGQEKLISSRSSLLSTTSARKMKSVYE